MKLKAKNLIIWLMGAVILGVGLYWTITKIQVSIASLTGDSHGVYLPVVSTPVDKSYFVAPEGSDQSGNGSYDRPWATISHAIDQAEDGSQILVRPGEYVGLVKLDQKFIEGVKIVSEVPYQARLRNNSQVLICFTCQGITIEGFDFAHTGPGADRYVVQVQNSDGTGGRNLVFRNNIFHDSYNNDLLKLNNGAQDILVENNVFYNQQGSDNHIDVTSGRNIIIQDNVFFNDFAGSNRPIENNTGSFIVIKDANGNEDGILGANQITVRRNVFLNWQGDIGNSFINLGDHSTVDYHHAYDILIENNLLLGNSNVTIHTPFKLISARDVTIRHNTVVGNLPAKAHGFRLAAGAQTNTNINFYNNIWSDPSGTMGANSSGEASKFAVTDSVGTFVLDNNLYWNGALGIPFNNEQPINYMDDVNAITGDPQLESNQIAIIPPRWLPQSNLFADGSSTIRGVFVQLAQTYGTLGENSMAIDRANPDHSPAADILGRPRSQPDIGAYER